MREHICNKGDMTEETCRQMDVSLEFLQERYELSIEKIQQIAAEEYEYAVAAGKKNAENTTSEKDDIAGDVRTYFKKVAEFICMADAYYEYWQQSGMKSSSVEAVKDWNYKLNLDILPENYGSSFANPAFAVEKYGEDYGRLLAALYAEVRSMISIATESAPEEMKDISKEAAEEVTGASEDKADGLEELLIRMELFVEVYSAFMYEWQETQALPSYESLRQILYWYVSDYSDITHEREIKRLHRIPGMLSGFLLGSSLTVQGGWWMVQGSGCIVQGSGLAVGGIIDSAHADITSNQQYEYDHREDLALVWDKAMMRRKLEVIRTVSEKYEGLLDSHMGNSMWISGEISESSAEFVPADKPQALHFSAEQQKLIKEYYSQIAIICGNRM